MLVCDYIVERIDGDYAMLKRTNLPEEEAKIQSVIFCLEIFQKILREMDVYI